MDTQTCIDAEAITEQLRAKRRAAFDYLEQKGYELNNVVFGSFGIVATHPETPGTTILIDLHLTPFEASIKTLRDEYRQRALQYVASHAKAGRIRCDCLLMHGNGICDPRKRTTKHFFNVYSLNLAEDKRGGE